MDPNGDNQDDALSNTGAEPDYLKLAGKWAVKPPTPYGQDTELDLYLFSTPAEASALATDLRQRAQAAKDTGTQMSNTQFDGVRTYGPAAVVEAGHPAPSQQQLAGVAACLGS